MELIVINDARINGIDPKKIMFHNTGRIMVMMVGYMHSHYEFIIAKWCINGPKYALLGTMVSGGVSGLVWMGSVING